MKRRNLTIRFIRPNMASVASVVLGGKNSNEKNVRCSATAALILSEIFMANDLSDPRGA
jgi:hypothetical protein